MRWSGLAGLIVWTALAVTASAAAPTELTPPAFFGPTAFSTGTGPLDLAIADTNGDGRRDLVTANATGKSISVLVNAGRGKFEPHHDYASLRAPRSLAIVDVNGDRRPDVMTAEPRPPGAGFDTSGGTVSEFVNQAGGGFRLERTIDACTFGMQFGTGDLNGDGKVDFATTASECYWSFNTLYIFLNEGNGIVKRPTICGTDWNRPPLSATIGDLNGDGKQDLVIGTFSSISVMLNDGAWEDCSSQGGRYTTGADVRYLAIADLNGDSKQDVVTASYYGDMVSVLLNNGNGVFGTHVEYPTGKRPTSLAVGDLNGDQKLDLATANSDARSISVLAGNGDGTFQAKRDFWANSSVPSAVAIGDLNGDHLADVAVANTDADAVSVFFNRTTVCRVPNVKGKKLQDAKRIVARAHCRARSKTGAKGRVVSQRPAPGTVLGAGGTVNLVLGKSK